jgi:hypothetical protein
MNASTDTITSGINVNPPRTYAIRRNLKLAMAPNSGATKALSRELCAQEGHYTTP